LTLNPFARTVPPYGISVVRIEVSLFISPTLTKGSVELLILSILDDEELYGYEITKRIEGRSGCRLRLRRSSIYPVLGRMEKRGWVERRWTKGSRRRCYYNLTETGSGALEEQREQWREFTQAVNAVLDPLGPAASRLPAGPTP
jgi:DNA-binding PadR family transcriptional regulator